MNKTEIRNTIGTFGSVRERQKQKREFVLDFIANTPPERRVQVPLGAMDQQAPPTALGDFIAKDPVSAAKGVGVAPLTAAPDLVGIGQHAVNAVADLLPDEFGVLRRDSSKPVFEEPISGDPIREAVGLDPLNPQGMVGEIFSPTSTIAKGITGFAKAVSPVLAFVRGGKAANKVTDLNRAPFIYDSNVPAATEKRRNVDVGIDLQEESIRVWGGKPMEMTPENAQIVAKNMTDEARESFKRRPEMAGWYKANLEEAMGYASEIHPELATDPQAQTAFKTIMAITSNGQEVPLNAKLTNQFYTKFKETGRFPIAGSGKEKKAMEIGFQHANEIIDDVGFDGFTEFLNKEFTVKQLQDAGFAVSGENVDTIVNGSVIFGPKIGGGFMQNLMGNYDPATFDRWWQRTYGRHSGTLIEPPLKIGDQRLAFAEALEDTPAEAFSALGMTKSDALANPDDAARVVLAGFTKGGFKVKSEVNNAARNLMKSLDNVVDSPAGGNQRNYMRSVITQVRDNLRAEGIQIDTADVQALLWYAEKDLYGKLGASSNTGRVDYATVWREIAEEARSSATP